MRNDVLPAIAALTALLTAAACATAPAEPPVAHAAPAPPVAPASVPPPVSVYREQGVASWYGRELHGRPDANGEPVNMYALTAAHRTLPLGTFVRVTSIDSFRSVVVRITDRGPLVRSGVIELSYGAAKELGFVEKGTARVRIETTGPAPEGAAVYTVHVGSFLEEENALVLKERLSGKYETVSVERFETNAAVFHHVRVGAYPTEELAERTAGKLTLEGVEPVVLRKER